MCIHLLGLNSASTWLVDIHVTKLHVQYSKRFFDNTDMNHTEDYMVV